MYCVCENDFEIVYVKRIRETICENWMERFIHVAPQGGAKNESFHARTSLSGLASDSEPFEGTILEIHCS